MGAEISFEQPTESYSPSTPTLNLFLHTLEENLELRSNERIVSRPNGSVETRRPWLRVDCSYLVTAWSGDGTGSDGALAEHRLLSQALHVLAAYPTIPAHLLVGLLRTQQESEQPPPPLPMMVAGPNGPDNPADFWTALGSRLRPAFTLRVTIAMHQDLAASEEPELVRTRVLDFPPDEDEKLIVLDDEVVDESGRGLFDARLELDGADLRAVTDQDGRYRFENVPAGDFTLRVQASGFVEHREQVAILDKPPPPLRITSTTA